jgi:hypothetical protein
VQGLRRGMAGMPRTRAISDYNLLLPQAPALPGRPPFNVGRNKAAHIYRRTMERDSAGSYCRHNRTAPIPRHPVFRFGELRVPIPRLSRASRSCLSSGPRAFNSATGSCLFEDPTPIAIAAMTRPRKTRPSRLLKNSAALANEDKIEEVAVPVVHFDNAPGAGEGLREVSTLAISRLPLSAWAAAPDCRRQQRR